MAGYDPRAECARFGVEIHYAALPAGLAAVYVCRGEAEQIALSPLLSPAQERCALAEELAHRDLGPGDLLGTVDHAAAARAERRARRIAADKLLPDGHVLARLGSKSLSPSAAMIRAWAAELDVTPALLAVKLGLLAERARRQGRPWRQEAS